VYILSREIEMLSDEFLQSANILIVDDDAYLLEMCRTALHTAGYKNVKTTPDPRGVLASFVECQPDLLILDVMMPHLDGLQLLQLLQSSVRGGLAVPVLVITAFPTPLVRHIALTKGAVDVLAKPFSCQELVLRIRNLLKIRLALCDVVRDMEEQNQVLSQELVDRTEELSTYQLKLKEAQLEVIARLARAGEQRDDDTGQHTQRVAVTSGLIAQTLGFEVSQIEIIQRAAPLHDVGKIGMPDSILLKPGKLTQDEFQRMQQHCLMGSQLLSGGRSDIVQVAERIALSHHEKWSGGGYPLGLGRADIPVEGRILAVADVFDALTHERPYKPAWPIADAVAEITNQSGQQFDPQVVEAFLTLPHEALV
jgi:putative two-component system response regulator